MDASPSNAEHHVASSPQARRAFPAIVSNTGCTSVCELLITRRISLVAVCCSRRSCNSVNKPYVLDRDHGLVGEGLKQLDLL